jgi:alkylation response protein AidB-like acyl-CoA dehydrogenase
VVLTEVFVPEAAISGRRPSGPWHPLFHIIGMIAFALIYSAYVGVAEGARARALESVRRKSPDPSVAELVGAIENAFASTEMAWERMVDVAQNGAPGPETTNRAMICRTLLAQGAIATVEKAMEAVGGASFYRDAGLERAFRDVQGARFHPLQDAPQRRYSGRVALGWDIDG